ncbi:MAG: hypothetical protein HY049_02375 [Acidobacteria bacterium]|nr:hypothetical protein [Acidobacteriota bacterium]
MSQQSTRTSIRIGERLHEVSLQRRGARVVASVDGREYRLNVHESHGGVYSLLPLDEGGAQVEVQVAPSRDDAGMYHVRVRGRAFEARAEAPGSRERETIQRSAGAGPRPLKSVMPGRIVRLLVEAGASVKRGQGIIVVEAMKMENELPSSKDGIVTQILVSPGDRVESGATLAIIE